MRRDSRSCPDRGRADRLPGRRGREHGLVARPSGATGPGWPPGPRFRVPGSGSPRFRVGPTLIRAGAKLPTVSFPAAAAAPGHTTVRRLGYQVEIIVGRSVTGSVSWPEPGPEPPGRRLVSSCRRPRRAAPRAWRFGYQVATRRATKLARVGAGASVAAGVRRVSRSGEAQLPPPPRATPRVRRLGYQIEIIVGSQ